MSKPSKIIRATVAVLLFAITFVLLYFALAPKKYSLEVGQTAVEDIVAQSTIVDNVQTEALRQQAEESVDTVYDVIPGASLRVSESVGIIMDIIDSASEDDVLSDIQTEIKNNVDITLETSTIEHILAMSQSDRNEMKEKMLAILSEVYQDEVSPDKLDEMKDYTYQYIDNTWMSQISKIEARNILGKVMVANVEENEAKTLAAKEEARNSVEAITYVEGSKIVTKGEVITQEKYDLLKSNGLLEGNQTQDLFLYGGIIFFIAVLLLMLALYLYQFERYIFNQTTKLFMILCQIIIYLALANLIVNFNAYLIPISMLAVTLALVLKPKLALIINIFAVMLVAFSIKAEATLIIIMLSSGILSAIFMKRIITQSGIYKYSFIIGILNAFILLVSDIILYDVSINTAINCAYIILASIVAGFGSVGMVYLWEWLFNIPTSIRMLDIASLNHPLVKKLMQLAPGTYQHSLNVSSLAEAAAEEINADVLLAKAGGLFHDIGKLEDPNYFCENQQPDKNPHDKLRPVQSAQILKKHVSDGVALSKKYKLPKLIQDIIQTHQGTSVMEYFYHKEKNNQENVDTATYRYDGPKPVMKEAAIVMLADSCEAAVKSIIKPTEAQIYDMVQKIFYLKQSDGQLSESELTFSELNKIKKIFIRNLNAMYHERIQYPHQDDDIEKMTQEIQDNFDDNANKAKEDDKQINSNEIEDINENKDTEE